MANRGLLSKLDVAYSKYKYDQAQVCLAGAGFSLVRLSADDTVCEASMESSFILCFLATYFLMC
jgi:hypothetical protein